MTSFTTRATTVADNLAGLGLGSIVPEAYDEMSAADARVEDAVAKVVNGLAGEPDYPTLAAALVDGSLTPAKAGAKLTGPTGSRVQNLAAAVRSAAVAAEECDELAAAALRRSCVPIVRERLQRTAEDMLTTIAGLPAPCRDHLAAVYEGDSVHYGPLTADQLDGLLDVVAPGGLSTVSPTALAAVQRAQAAWSWWNEASASFGPLFWLGTGRQVRRGWDTTEVTGDGAAEAKTFDPALLLVAEDAVDYVAAGVPLAFAVASGLVESFDVLADPFGERDAEAYRERVDRVEQFTTWRDAYRNLNMSGAAGLIGGPDQRSRAALKRRATLPKLDQVREFRAFLDEKVAR